jgi:hypothetical protein
VGPSGQVWERKKEKEKGSVFYWAQRGLGRLEAQLSSARLAVQLGLRLSRPARAGAGWARHGLARLGSFAGRLPLLHGLGLLFSSSPRWADLLSSPPRWAGPSPPRGWLRLLLSPSHCQLGPRRQRPRDPVWRPGSGAAGASACVRVCGARRRVRCERPEGARGNASTAWPRHERDVAVASRG